MSVLVYDGVSAFSDRDSTRRVLILSDGSILAFVKTDSTTFTAYHSTDRSTFTAKFAISTAPATFSAFSCAIEANNNIQVVYQTTSTNSNLVWRRYTYSAGTWSLQTTQTIYSDTNRVTGSVDIDVLGTNIAACVVIWRELNGTNGQRVYAKARGSGGSFSTDVILYTAAASNQYSPNESVFCTADVAGPSSNLQRVYFGAVTNSQSGANGGFHGTARFDVTTGAYQGVTNLASDTFPEHIFTGNVPGASHRMLSFPNGNNSWYGVSFSNFTDNKCNVKAWIATWNGTTVVITTGPSFAMPASTSELIKPSAVKLSNNKIAVFTRGLSTGGVYCAVIDMVSLTNSPAFLYTLPLLAIPLTPFSGAQRNVGTNADIIAVFPTNGDTYHDYNQTPAVPTNISPVASAIVNTDVPLLQATLPLSQFTVPHKAQWQIASDSIFTTGIRTVIEPDQDYDIFEVHTENTPPSAELTQGIWYIKALTIDAFGKQSAYTSGQSFVVSHAPEAANLTPDNTTRQYGIATVFDWDFIDVSSTDFQTAFQIIIEKLADGSLITDTGKVLSTISTHSLTIPIGGKDLPLRWKVRLWDSDDVVGPYSEYKITRVSDLPVVNITFPANDATIDTPTPAITWTYSSTSGSPQTGYRVLVKDRTVSQNLLYDSGLLTGAILTHSIPPGIIINGNVTLDMLVDENGNPLITEGSDYISVAQGIVDYSVTVQVFDSFGLSGTDVNNFSTSWEQPDQPVFDASSTNYSLQGFHSITWDNGEQDPEFVAYRVYRRVVGELPWTRVFETSQVQSAYEYQDWLANADTTYEYTVVQSANRFGSQVESEFSQTEFLEAGTADYWLIHPTDSSKNFKLSHVTSEDFTDEYESEVLMLIARGRKVDYGTRWGYSGTLSCSVWDEPGRTARQARLLLEGLKRSKTAMYLRNPFGDSFLVDMQDLSIDRIAGVGTREFHTLTIPYVELEGHLNSLSV